MHAESQGLQSTKPKNTENEEELDSFLTPNEPNIKINNVCYAIVNLNKIITGYINLTGHFPKRSSRENKYILRAIPIKNRKGQTITEV